MIAALLLTLTLTTQTTPAPLTPRPPNCAISLEDMIAAVNQVSVMLFDRWPTTTEWATLLTHPWVGFRFPPDTDTVQRAIYLLGLYSGDITNPWLEGRPPFLVPWRPRAITCTVPPGTYFDRPVITLGDRDPQR